MRDEEIRANSARMAPAVGAVQLARLLDGWARGTGALQAQLTTRLRVLVRTGVLPSGTRLPSERSLGEAISVSRNTVASAFDALRSEGVLTSRQGDGTYVSGSRRHLQVRGDARLTSFIPESGGSAGVIDLRSAALPGLAVVGEVLEDLGRSAIADALLTHGYVPAGTDELRAAVATYYTDLGLPTRPEQILVTSGAQQALRLAAEGLIDRGSTVLIEDPSFRGAIESLRALGAQLVPVASDESGISPDAMLDAATKSRPALLVVQSTVNNPTGSVLTHYRRRRVVELAATFGIPIIDDATPLDALIDGQQPLPLAAYGDNVITVGSVSKSFWGGLRVGWLRADPDMATGLTALKGGEDLGTSLVAQALSAKLLPRIAEAREQRRAVLAPLRDAVLAEVSAVPGWTPMVPKGGASLWVDLGQEGAIAFAQSAERFGVRVLAGPTFSSADGLDHCIRIAFAGGMDETMAGIARLAEAWSAFRPHPADWDRPTQPESSRAELDPAPGIAPADH